MSIDRPTEDQRFQKAADLFDAARSMPSDERVQFLNYQCAGDDELRNDVDNLLSHHDQSDGFLERPVVLKSTFGQVLEETVSGEPLPEKIGGYIIRGLLGKGGMGIVYLAEQKNPQRQCAIKVIRPAVLDSESRQRFKLETELLGRLQHPGIAQIYEAGVHHNSVADCPFFAMELVDGLPLIQHVKKHNTSVHERLQILIGICETVHYAHQKGVIHRDLKPGNILVSIKTDRVAGKSTTVNPTSESNNGSHLNWQTKILDFASPALSRKMNWTRKLGKLASDNS